MLSTLLHPRLAQTRRWRAAAVCAGLALVWSLLPAWAAPEIPGGLVEPKYRDGIAFTTPTRIDPVLPQQELGLVGPGEPTIRVDSTGVIFATAAYALFATSTPVWASYDDGATFVPLKFADVEHEWSGPGGEGDLVVTDDGRVLLLDIYVGGADLTEWSDRGRRFERHIPVVLGAEPIYDRPYLAEAKDPDGSRVLYMVQNHGLYVNVYRSTDAGLTWSSVYGGIDVRQRPWPATLVADPRPGAPLYFVGRCSGVNDHTICAVVSEDQGATWITRQVVAAPRGKLAWYVAATAVDADGRVFVAFSDQGATGCDLYLAVSEDAARSWRTMRINESDGCAMLPWVAAGSDGDVAISYYWSDSRTAPAQAPETAAWHLKAAVVEDTAKKHPTITFGTLATPVLHGPLDRQFLEWQQVAVGPDGRFHIAYNSNEAEGCTGEGHDLTLENALSDRNDRSFINRCVFHVGQLDGPAVGSPFDRR